MSTLTRIHRVTGMTCEHRVRAVGQEVSGIRGVTTVHIEPATGDVTVSSTHEIAYAELAAAINGAGYALHL